MIELAAVSLLKTGALRLRVSGSSMLPAVRPGDVLTIHRCPARDAARGDLLLVRRGDRFFVHRMLRREGDAIVTRGDAVRSADPPVAFEDLLGKVVSIERRGRSVTPPASTGPATRVAAWAFARSALAGRLFTRWNTIGGRA